MTYFLGLKETPVRLRKEIQESRRGQPNALAQLLQNLLRVDEREEGRLNKYPPVMPEMLLLIFSEAGMH